MACSAPFCVTLGKTANGIYGVSSAQCTFFVHYNCGILQWRTGNETTAPCSIFLCFLLADEQKRSGDGEVAPSDRQAAETLCPLALAFYM